MLDLVLAAAIAWQIQQPPSQHSLIDAGDTFESVGIRWSSPATVRVRASNDRQHWTAWLTLTLDGDLTDASESRYLSAITHLGAESRWLEVDFSAPPGDVILTFFPPQRVAQTLLSVPAQAGGVRLRAEWGCPDGEASRVPPEYTTVTHAVVHHTAGTNEAVDWDAEVRSIWYYHVYTTGWSDIGYYFLIDPNGVIYEGRAGGPGVIGAHFSCRNSNTVGIALLGTFMTQAPTAAALHSLELLLAAICSEDHIDPTAIAFHPSSGLNLPTILGHRDGNVPGATCTITECPGDVLYSMLPAIRSDVAAAAGVPRARRHAVRR